MKFVDIAQIEITAGNGGGGCVSFHREKFMPKGGPDGGDGGDGGSVTIVATSQLHTLQDMRYNRKYKADNGRPGEGNNRSGKKGKDITITVPVGTLIKNFLTISASMIKTKIENQLKKIASKLLLPSCFSNTTTY